MRQQVVSRIQGTLGRFGFQLLRTEKEPVGKTGARDDDRFFPVGPRPHTPWVVPQDLLDSSQAWAKTLVGLYDNELSWPGSIAPEGGMLLQLLVRNLQPRVIVETGTFVGASTIWMASGLQALGRGELHAFDLFDTPPIDSPEAAALFRPMRTKVEERLRQAGVADLVTLHQGDSATNLLASHEQLRAAGGVQLALIDGDHSPEGALADLRAVEPVLQVGGYVVLHDIYPDICSWDGPRWLLDNLSSVSRARYQVCELYLAQTNYGLAVLRRTR